MIQLGPDPLFTRTPIRNFPSDVALAGETASTLLALIAEMARRPRDATVLDARRARIATAAAADRAALRALAEKVCGGPMTKAWVSACHQVAEAPALPVIVLVLTNREWGAVRHSVLGLYPGGQADRANDVPLSSLRPSPDFTLTAAASRAHTKAVTEGRELPAALDRAIRGARTERRQVLLNIAISPD